MRAGVGELHISPGFPRRSPAAPESRSEGWGPWEGGHRARGVRHRARRLHRPVRAGRLSDGHALDARSSIPLYMRPPAGITSSTLTCVSAPSRAVMGIFAAGWVQLLRAPRVRSLATGVRGLGLYGRANRNGNAKEQVWRAIEGVTNLSRGHCANAEPRRTTAGPAVIHWGFNRRRRFSDTSAHGSR